MRPHLENDYLLLDSEKRLIQTVTSSFNNVVLVMNTVGAVDLSWTDNYPSIRSILYVPSPGEQGANALADILTGRLSPSGKLSSTIVRRYEDHPASAHFSFDKAHPENILTYASYGLDAAANGSVGYQISPVSVYAEGIYAGYRYFDSYSIQPLYPFGFGLSYTTFAIDGLDTAVEGKNLVVTATVTNTGRFTGKEVVQVYLSAPAENWDQPYQQLKGYVKTSALAPGQSETVQVTIPTWLLASYDESTARYILEAGEYIVRAGNSSRNTHVAGKLAVAEELITAQYTNILPILPQNREKLSFCHGEKAVHIGYPGEDEEIASAKAVSLSVENVPLFTENLREMPALHTIEHADLKDAREHRVSLYDFVNQMTDDELAAMCVGYGPGLPFGCGRGTPATIQGP